MITTLLIILLGIIWLLKETDYLRVRLPVGALPNTDALQPIIEPLETPEYTSDSPIKDVVYCDVCYVNKCKHKPERGYAWEIPARTVNTSGSVTHFAAGCNLYRAQLIRELIQAGKPRQLSFSLPIRDVIHKENIRYGSHVETRKWETGGHKHVRNDTVEDYHIVYKSGLVSEDWLKEHEHDLDGWEPTIDIKVAGQELHVNGNYKKGLIADFFEPYTEKVRAGQRSMVIWKGQSVEKRGFGKHASYIAVDTEETESREYATANS